MVYIIQKSKTKNKHLLMTARGTERRNFGWMPFLMSPMTHIVNQLVSWCFTALSAQIGYIMP